MSKQPGNSKIDLTWASPGQQIWIELPEDDPSGEAYKKGQILNLIDEETASVQFEGSAQPITMKGDKIFLSNNYANHPEGYDDMVEIENLSEAELLYNVQLRYRNQQIYTYVGPTLIVVNPFQKIEKLLSQEMLKSFQDPVIKSSFDPKDHIPHVYAIAGATMQKMFEDYKNQAIVISGESGAGKTENAKHAMKFLTSLSSSNSKGGDSKGVEDRILACNPILEAFGNAKTVRNDNSSRFGKYVSLLVEKKTKAIVGATITNYLLEKSRVCGQTSEERNYHIYYALLRGAKPEMLKELCLVNDLNAYEYVKNGFKDQVKTVPDEPLFQEVNESFETMAFTASEQNTVWSYTAASLLLGNVVFDDSTLDDKIPCNVKNEDILKNVAKILGLDFSNLLKALRFKLRTIGGSTIESTINKEECITYRDGLAKDLFNRLFNWLVKRLNYNVMPEHFVKPGANITELMKGYFHIGLLDIFGFEIFKVNSLEQFCINFANERLQQLYVSYVFKAEEREFINEGLKDYLHELNFKDNQILLDMLDGNKPPGIFQLVDEASTVNTTDSALCTKIVTQFKKPEYPFTTAKLARDTFIVKHSAKDVEYNTTNFRAKNKDELSKFIEDTLEKSSIPDVAKVWKNLCMDEVDSPENKKAANPKDKFLGYKFRTQMKDLIDELNSCECHFVRCIKPNEKKEAALFVSGMVLQQIQYMGVLDTIKVRKASYPVRKLYRSFYDRYQELDPINSKVDIEVHDAKGSDFKELARGICQKVVPQHGTSMILYGNTRILLRIDAVKDLERKRMERIKKKNLAAAKFQAAWFGMKDRRKYKDLRKGVLEAQRLFRVGKEFQKYQRIRRMAKKIQKWWRYLQWRKSMQKLMKSNVKIQAWWKSQFHSRKYNKKMKAIKLINRIWRGAVVRRKIIRLRHVNEIMEQIIAKGAVLLMRKFHEKAARVISRYGRGYICRKKYHKEVAHIKLYMQNYLYNKNIGILQRNIRGFIVRATISRMNKAASYIQGYVRMRWLSALFQGLRINTIKIQKAVRAWILKRHIVENRMQEFIKDDCSAFESSKKSEQLNFFGGINASRSPKQGGFEDKKRTNTNLLPGLKEINASTTVLQVQQLHQKRLSQAQLNSLGSPSPQGPAYVDYEEQEEPAFLNVDRVIDPYTAPKIHLFARVLDVEPLSDLTEVYDPQWSIQTLQLQNECMRTDAELQIIDVGQAHTISISNANKVYSYGWNDCYQLGRTTSPYQVASSCAQVSVPNENLKPKIVAVGDDHNLMADYDGNLYVWGDNSQGQLGLGHFCQTSGVTTLTLTKNDPIKEVKAKGNQSIAITEKGKAFCWPTELYTGEVLARPLEMALPPKIEIATAACGYNFAMLVSRNGLIFSFGKDNKAGQLGHGDTSAREIPTLIETLKNSGEKVSAVSCGFKHVICKTTLGKVYTWGWGAKGQLGHSNFENQMTPKELPLTHHGVWMKTIQVQAGYKHSMALLDNKKLLWWGSNSSISDECAPIEVSLGQKIPNMNADFTPVRVLCAWSKTANVTYITIADTRAVNINATLKNKVVGTLTAKLEETNAVNDLNPPTVPSISKYFSIKVMDGILTKEKKTTKPGSKMQTFATKVVSPLANEMLRGPYHSDSLLKTRQSPTSTKNYQQEDTFEARYNTSPVNRTQQVNNNSYLSVPRLSPSGKTPTPRSSPSQNNSMGPKKIVSDLKQLEPMPVQAPRSTPQMKKTLADQPERPRPDVKVTSQQEKPKVENKINEDNILQKLAEIKKKMEELARTPKSLWSKADQAFWKYATDPQMYALLKDIQA